MSALDDLTRKLGLLQTVSKDAAKKWAQRTRAVKAGNKWDQAAMIAATELFPSEFDPIGYRREAPSIEALVRAHRKPSMKPSSRNLMAIVALVGSIHVAVAQAA